MILCGNFTAEGGETKFRPPLASFVSSWSPKDKKRLIGYTYEEADPDGITRRIPLLISTKDRTYYSIDLLAYCHFNDLPLEEVKFFPERQILQIGKLQVPHPRKGMLINFFASEGAERESSMKKKPYFSSSYIREPSRYTFTR